MFPSVRVRLLLWQGPEAHRVSLNGYPVYRIDRRGSEPVQVGSVLEFRRSRRSMNRLGLAKLAQKLFAQAPGDIIVVGSDSSLERRQFAEAGTLALRAG